MISPQFHREAEDEFLDAISYYALRNRDVAANFVEEVRSALELLGRFPESAPTISSNVRRKVLTRFPYSILYTVRDDHLFVLALMRDGRRPEYWKHRV